MLAKDITWFERLNFSVVMIDRLIADGSDDDRIQRNLDYLIKNQDKLAGEELATIEEAIERARIYLG